jgi:hypothetical protein
METSTWVIAEAAWAAGAIWAADQRPASHVPGGTRAGAPGELIMITATSQEPLDPRTHATILAALRFYAENQLVYGAVAGQLDVEEVKGLIAKLEPQQQEEVEG